VLAEGLAPEDFLSYYKQQFRWARGSLDVIYPVNKLRSKGINWKQKLQYYASISFYFSGVIVVLNALIPLVYFFTGAVPLVTSTMILALIFLPYIILTLFILQRSSNFTFTFRSLAFSMGQFNIHLLAIWSALTRQKVSFSITPKTQQAGNFTKLVIPHITYVVVALMGMSYAFHLHGLTSSFIANSAWALINISVFLPVIYAASPKSQTVEFVAPKPVRKFPIQDITAKTLPVKTI
jgi:cellulose synthase (UDP-forming)